MYKSICNWKWKQQGKLENNHKLQPLSVSRHHYTSAIQSSRCKRSMSTQFAHIYIPARLQNLQWCLRFVRWSKAPTHSLYFLSPLGFYLFFCGYLLWFPVLPLLVLYKTMQKYQQACQSTLAPPFPLLFRFSFFSVVNKYISILKCQKLFLYLTSNGKSTLKL